MSLRLPAKGPGHARLRGLPHPFLLAASLAMGLGTTGCCRIIEAVLIEGAPEPEPSPTGPAQELGTAAFPAGSPPTGAAIHTWSAKRLPPGTFRLGYALERDEARDVEADYRAFASKVSFADESKGKFRWVPPPGCSGDLHCVYENLVSRDRADLIPLVERFRARRTEAKLGTMDLAWLVVTFVQSIKYEIPEKSPFGILPPALVAAQKRGDCDSKTLLGLILLKEMGIDGVLLSSSAHTHAMLGIALPAPGTKITYQGRDYMFTEMTAKGSPIGHVNPELLRPNDWRVVPFRYPAGGGSTTPAPTSPKPVSPRPISTTRTKGR